MAPKRKSDEPTEPKAKVAKKDKVDPVEGLTANVFLKSKDVEFTGPGGVVLVVKPTKFSSGTFGWKASSKLNIVIQDGDKERSIPTSVSLNINIPKAASKKIIEASGDDEHEEGDEQDEDDEAEEELPKPKKKAPAKKDKAAAVEEDDEEEEEPTKPKKKPASRKK